MKRAVNGSGCPGRFSTGQSRVSSIADSGVDQSTVALGIHDTLKRRAHETARLCWSRYVDILLDEHERGRRDHSMGLCGAVLSLAPERQYYQSLTQVRLRGQYRDALV